MNQIILRTHKGEYFPGEDIYGVVYLNVVSATAGRGIRLTLQGVEQFSYKSGHQSGTVTYEAKKEYVDYPDVELYRSQDLFTLGSYVFPFRIRLQAEIPGSFYGRGTEGATWEADVNYWLTAQLIDAETLHSSQSFVVNHPLPKGISEADPPQGVTLEVNVPRFLIFKKKLFVTIKLMNNIHQSGGVLKLRIIITNQSRINVVSIIVRLVREITLITKHNKSIGTKHSSIHVTQNRAFISPENGPKIMSQAEITGCDPALMNNRGVDKFCVTLRDENDFPIPPSVNGHHIQCRHVIEVTVRLQNSTVETAVLPVPSIHHQSNQKWYDWKPPEWVRDTEIKITDSPFSVPGNILRSEPFSGIPRFQILNE